MQKQNLSLLFFLISFLFCPIIRAQEKDELKFIKEAGEIKISFFESHFYDKSFRLPFKDIQVFDYRFDSSKICYVDKSCDASYCKVQLAANWSVFMNSYFRQNLDTSSQFSLIVIIRSFWMQKGITDELTAKKVVKSEWLSKKDYWGYCKAGIDIFAKTEDSFYALFKIDDVFFNSGNFKPASLKNWFFLPFDSVARRLNQENITHMISLRNKFSWQKIEPFYNSRLEIPVLKEAHINKGVFVTFQDFQNNKALNVPFRIAKGSLTDELYTGEKENESILSDFWGAFDGKTLYIRSSFNIYPSKKEQNTFEIYGSKHIDNVHNAPQPGQLIRINNMEINEKILHLNMEDGKFY